MEAFPDPRSLGTGELKTLLNALAGREGSVSAQRRELHHQIDALRGELVRRLRERGDDVIFGTDPPDDGPAGVREPRNPRPSAGSDSAALPPPHDSDL